MPSILFLDFECQILIISSDTLNYNFRRFKVKLNKKGGFRSLWVLRCKFVYDLLVPSRFSLDYLLSVLCRRPRVTVRPSRPEGVLASAGARTFIEPSASGPSRLGSARRGATPATGPGPPRNGQRYRCRPRRLSADRPAGLAWGLSSAPVPRRRRRPRRDVAPSRCSGSPRGVVSRYLFDHDTREPGAPRVRVGPGGAAYAPARRAPRDRAPQPPSLVPPRAEHQAPKVSNPRFSWKNWKIPTLTTKTLKRAKKGVPHQQLVRMVPWGFTFCVIQVPEGGEGERRLFR